MTAMPLVGHSGGLGWDELVFLAVPVVLLVALQLVGRRRRDDDGSDDDPSGDEVPGRS